MVSLGGKIMHAATAISAASTSTGAIEVRVVDTVEGMTALAGEWEALSRENPKLVLVRISGYGQDGPYSRRPGFAAIAAGTGSGADTSPGLAPSTGAMLSKISWLVAGSGIGLRTLT